MARRLFFGNTYTHTYILSEYRRKTNPQVSPIYLIIKLISLPGPHHIRSKFPDGYYSPRAKDP